jgi:hypothetical protein
MELGLLILLLVSAAPTEKKTPVKTGGTSFTRIMSEKEKREAAMEEMFSKAKRLDFEDEQVEGIPRTGNTDAGYNDDDWE